ncbi:hypothetical protein C8F04DRAFT_620165 [Mycena alexandri]|uniref:Uncharacterized protein n=1 Tax=Mycena alexandri TaxID=1745969 RepID=A0AAD6SWA8_9AGAR|nr:hypothetical protein C8F04DRAFT_620165 [Mycena alexandri]
MRDAKSRSGPVGMHTKVCTCCTSTTPSAATFSLATNARTCPPDDPRNPARPPARRHRPRGDGQRHRSRRDGPRHQRHRGRRDQARGGRGGEAQAARVDLCGVAQLHAERVGVDDGEWVQPGAYCNQLRAWRRPQTRDGRRCGGGDRMGAPRACVWREGQSMDPRRESFLHALIPRRFVPFTRFKDESLLRRYDYVIASR